jgi:hypothetical protein
MPEKTVRVIPAPDLPPNDFIPGIGPEGAELPESEARPLIDAGLVVVKPDAKPAPAKEND